MARTASPLVSVIVPVYDVEKYIDECLESIVNQTYENLEIILVDDATPDKSGQKCDDWAKKDKRVKVIHKLTNEGLFHARLTGFETMRGKYFITVDSDDYIAEDFVEKLLGKAVSSGADIVASSACMWAYDNGDKKRQKFPMLYAESDVLENLLKKIVASKEKFGWNVWGKMYETEVYNKARKYLSSTQGNINAGEDILFSIMFAYFAKSAAYVPSYAGYFYRQNSQSIMHGAQPEAFIRKLDSVTSVMWYVEQFLKAVDLFGEYKNELTTFKEYLIGDNVWAIKNEHIRVNTQLQEQMQDLRRYNAELQQLLQELVDSKSYKLGRAIVSPYVKVKTLIKKIQKQ